MKEWSLINSIRWFGRPHDVADNKSACTADSWSFWALYLGPVLLHGKFLKNAYYNHFIDLVKLIQICLQFEISRQDVVKLHIGLQKWVQEYER